ncbi:MAG: sugar ABC transporter substrate-binding protein [Clostridia bacterium]|nr:sugar ABC transporter substrate-binding protein [Clostridia bacterium]
MRAKVTLINILLLNIIILCSCQQKMEPTNVLRNESDKITIGFSMDSFMIERWQRDRDIFVSRANDLGAEVIVQIAGGDPDEQIKQIEYLINKNVDVLVIIPREADGLGAVVNEARKKGIKVISYDRLIKDTSLDLYISFDNELVGELIADTLVRHVPKGNYVIFNGPESDNNVSLLRKGYYNILNPKIQSGDITVTHEFWTPNWEPEQAGYNMEELLRKQEKIDAIIAGNDSIATVLVRLLSENRMAGKVAIGGQDAEVSACQRIVEGTQLMTVYKPIDKLARLSAELAVQLAKGEEIIVNGIYEDGEHSIPYYEIMPVAVTKENMMDTVIKDGFQRLESVYQNIPPKQWPKN